MDYQSIKLVLAGQAATGKTSILMRIMHDIYSEYPNSTIGVDFQVKQMQYLDPETNKEIPVRLQIWDTAGQERFHAVVGQFFRNANAVLYVIDANNYDSFCELKEFWIPLVERSMSELPVQIIAMNKIECLADPNYLKEVEDFAEDGCYSFICCSAKESTNINKIFSRIVQLSMEKLQTATLLPQIKTNIKQLSGNKKKRRCC